MINFKKLCGFGVEEISVLSRPKTNATTTVSGNGITANIKQTSD
jgi:hypothetical protein